MAELERTEEGRAYYKLVHLTHEHIIYLDEIDIHGDGITSDYLQTYHTSESHVHDIEGGEIIPTLDSPSSTGEHSHGGEPTAEELALAIMGETYRTTGMMAGLSEATDTDPEPEPEPEPEPDEPVDSPGISYDELLDAELPPPPPPFDECNNPAGAINTELTPFDWTKRTEQQPFYSITSSEYCVTVKAPLDFIPEDNDSGVPGSLITRGILLLAAFYNKETTPISRRTMRNSQPGIEAEYRLSLRPGGRAKVLVKIPARLFNVLPDKVTCGSTPGVPFTKTVYEITKTTKSVPNSVPNLEEQIDTVIKWFYPFDRNKCAKIPGLNLRNEGRRLKLFLSEIKRLLDNNKCKTGKSQKSYIELGFSLNNEVLYATHISDQRTPLCIGFYGFVNTYPVNNPRTVAYISKLPEITTAILQHDLPLAEFIATYDPDPCTATRPSLSNTLDDFGLPGGKLISDIEKGLPDFTNVGDAIDYAKGMFETGVSTARDISSVYQSAGDVLRDDRLFSDPTYAQEQAGTQVGVNFVGDTVISELGDLIEELGRQGVEGIELIFSEILNKVDLPTLALFAAAGVLGEFPNAGNMLKGAVDAFFEQNRNLHKSVVNSALSSGLSIRPAFKVIGEQAAAVGEDDTLEEELDASGALTEMGKILDSAAEIVSNIPGDAVDLVMDIAIAFSNRQPSSTALIHVYNDVYNIYLDEKRLVFDELIEDICTLIDLSPENPMSTNDLIAEAGKIAAAHTAAAAFTQAILSGIPEPTKVGKESATQVAELLAKVKVIEQICDPKGVGQFSFPDLPSLPRWPSLPDLPSMPTWDYLGFVMPEIEIRLKDLILTAIVNIAIEMIKASIDFDFNIDPAGICSCIDPSYSLDIGGTLDFGGININSMFAHSLNLDTFNDLASVMGKIVDLFACTPLGEQFDMVGERMSGFFNEASSTLTPTELFSLFEGKATQTVLDTVQDIMNRTDYDDVRQYFINNFTSESEIIDFFSHVSGFVNNDTMGLAREQSSNRAANVPATSQRQKLLNDNYGDSLSGEQIDGELEKNSKQDNMMATKILQNSSAAPPQAVKVPPAIGGEGALIPTPPIVKYMADRTLETMFESVVMTFDSAVHGSMGFVQTLCFKSRQRPIYEMYRQTDRSTRNSMLYSGKDLPVYPYHIIGPFESQGWDDRSIDAGGSSQRLSEINEGVLAAIRLYLSAASFSGRKTNPISFPLPTPIGNMTWTLKEAGNKQDFVHTLRIPAPQLAPYPVGSSIEIKTRTAIDVAGFGSDVPDILDRVSDIGPGGTRTPQNDPVRIFSALATQDLENAIPGLTTRHIKKYLKDKSYYRTMADIMKMFMDQVLNSGIYSLPTDPYTVSKTIPTPAQFREGAGPFAGDEFFIPNPKAVANWRLEPKSDTDGTTQTTLLYLEELREEVKQRLENSPLPGPNEESTAPMQKAIMSGAIEALIRVHVVEMFLKTLPIFDIFQKDDIITEEFVKYVVLKVQESCVRQDPFFPGYYEDVLDEAKILYESEWESNGKNLVDPLTGENFPSPKRISSDVALEYLVKKVIYDMGNEIRKLDMFSTRMPKPIYKTFLNKMLDFPSGMFQAPKKATITDDVSLPGANIEYVYDDRFEELIRPKARVDIDGHTLDTHRLKPGLETFDDGGLLLEKYIQYHLAGEPNKIKIRPVSDLDSLPTNARGKKFGMRLVYMPELSSDLREDSIASANALKEHEDSFNMMFTDAAAESLDFGFTHDDFSGEGRRAFKLTTASSTETSQIADHEHFVYLDELNDNASGQTSGFRSLATHNPIAEHEHFLEAGGVMGGSLWTSAHSGDPDRIRHTHINVESEEINFAKGLQNLIDAGDIPTPPLRQLPDSAFEAADDYRAFRILERFESVRKNRTHNYWDNYTGRWRVPGEDEEGNAGAWIDVDTFRWTYPLPLVSVVADEPIGEDSTFSDFKNELVNKMIEHDRFKLLFEHCFPLKKILSIMTIYTEVVFSSSGNAHLATRFDQVKETLGSIFDSVKNMNNYSHRDRNVESMGGNAGMQSGRKKRVFSGGRSRVIYENNKFTH